MLREQPDFPFCSERCRLIDLGRWASGSYVVSTPAFDPEEDSQGLTRTQTAPDAAASSDE